MQKVTLEITLVSNTEVNSDAHMKHSSVSELAN